MTKNVILGAIVIKFPHRIPFIMKEVSAFLNLSNPNTYGFTLQDLSLTTEYLLNGDILLNFNIKLDFPDNTPPESIVKALECIDHKIDLILSESEGNY